MLFLLVAFEDFVHALRFFLLVLGKEADQGDDDHGDCHGANAHFGGFCGGGGKSVREGDEQGCSAHGEKTGKDSCVTPDLGDLLGEQTPDVGSDEAAGNESPGEGHEADDDGNVLGCKDEGADYEGQAQNSGQKHLMLGLGFFFAYGGDQVNGNGGSRGQNHRFQRRHGGGEQKNHDDCQQNDSQRSVSEHLHQNRGNDGVNAALGELTVQNQS